LGGVPSIHNSLIIPYLNRPAPDYCMVIGAMQTPIHFPIGIYLGSGLPAHRTPFKFRRLAVEDVVNVPLCLALSAAAQIAQIAATPCTGTRLPARETKPRGFHFF
jgi:hypothetical protein